jgi:glutaminyl-tRNA synthetase
VTARLEPSLANAAPGSRWQFERHGYFAVDTGGDTPGPAFNRITGLKDSWGR